MIGRYSKGSYLGATPTAPSMYGATGVWSLASAARYRVDDEWPPLLTPPEPPVIWRVIPSFLGNYSSNLIDWYQPQSSHPILDYQVTATYVASGSVATTTVSGDAVQTILTLSGDSVIRLVITARSTAGYGLPSDEYYFVTGTTTVPSAPTITSITVS